MNTTTIITTVFALVVIFLFAVQKFSHQIQRVEGQRLKTFLANWTSSPVKGVIGGALISGLIQSSTATSVILVGLVNAGVMETYNAISVIVGANIATSITAQLVALNMTYISPLIVIGGFILTHTRSRYEKYGKAIFYFGLIFLTLFIVSNIVEPLKDNTDLIRLIAEMSNPYQAIIVGAVITCIVQSSSVFAGMTLILATSNLITLPIAIGFLLGSSIGSPITAIIASTSANFEAKKVALAHMLFNIIRVACLLPFLYPFISLLKIISSDSIQQIVNAHFLFNITFAIICLIFFKPFNKLVNFTAAKLYKGY